jgi:hypothetical protein
MKDSFLPIYYQGMARVMPSLKTNHRVATLREQVNDLTLAFISPLNPEDH